MSKRQAKRGPKPDKYESYMASSAWAAKREQVLKRDGYRCQTCHETERLEVHHATYERLGNENLGDLLTLCRDCHSAITNVIRGRRYERRSHKPSEVPTPSTPLIQAKPKAQLLPTEVQSIERTVVIKERIQLIPTEVKRITPKAGKKHGT